jgi:hypothetical protein
MSTQDKLHYKGDRRNYDPKQVYGPDIFGGNYIPVGAEYDEDADMTTIYFHPFVPPVRPM